jgi:hypothetical protein
MVLGKLLANSKHAYRQPLFTKGFLLIAAFTAVCYMQSAGP